MSRATIIAPLRRIPLKAVAVLLLLTSAAGALLRVGAPQEPHGAPQQPARATDLLGRVPLSFEANLGQTDERVRFTARTRAYTLFLTGDEAVFALRPPTTSGIPLFETRNPKIANRRAKTEIGNWQFENRNLRIEDRDSKLGNGNWPLINEIPSSGGPKSGILNLPSLLRQPAPPVQNPKSRIQNPPAPRTQQPPPVVLRMKLVGANLKAAATGLDELPGKSNYFRGNDPAKWRRNVPNYAAVKYESVYQGIDLIYYGNQRHLEYDFVVAPGADPQAIRFDVDDGNSKLENRDPRIDANGDLVISTEAGDVRFHKPVVYQEQESVVPNPELRVPSPGSSNRQSSIINRESVDGHYVLLANNQVGFELGSYDRTRPLVIDPYISYAALLGGLNDDLALDVAVDAAGNAYFTGLTFSWDFPLVDPVQGTTSNSGLYADAFVTKINFDGTAILYSTYLGGALDDYGLAIALDSLGNMFVAGYTVSADFPTVNALQPHFVSGAVCSLEGPSCGGSCFLGDPCADGFVAKLNAAGSDLVYSTYLGGSRSDFVAAIAANALGNAFVTGATWSPEFPTIAGGFDTTCGTDSNCSGGESDDAFVSMINPDGSSLAYSTFLGGSSFDEAGDIAVDGEGAAYVSGLTTSDDFPTSAGSFQAAKNNGIDGFVTKVDPAGSDLIYSTFIGGDGDDLIESIALGSMGDAYLTGSTYSFDFPVVNSIQPSHGGGMADAFVSKLNLNGTNLIYSTYLGGNSEDSGRGIAVATSGSVFVTGDTGSSDFPLFTPVQTTCVVDVLFCYDGFVSQLNASGNGVLFSTYFGGTGHEIGTGLATDNFGNAYVSTYTNNTVFLMSAENFNLLLGNDGRYHGGGYDALIMKFSPDVAPQVGVSQVSVTFPEQGLTGEPYPVVIGNFTSVPITITAIEAVNDDLTPTTQFAVDVQDCLRTYAVGERCTVYVLFTPTPDTAAASALEVPAVAGLRRSRISKPPGPPQLPAQRGTRTGRLLIRTGLSAASAVELPGTLLPSAAVTSHADQIYLKGEVALGYDSVSPMSLTFAPQTVGTTSPSQTVTLTNDTDNLALGVYSVSVTGDFSQTGTCGNTFPISIPIQGSCTFQVTFSPTSAGPTDGTLTITANAVGGPNVVTLQGTGTDFAVSIPPDERTKTVTAGQTATYNLELAPTGYSGNVALSCTFKNPKPSETTYSISPPTVEVNGSDPAPFTVKVTTTARSSAPPRGPTLPPGPPLPPLAMPLFLAILLILTGAGLSRHREGFPARTWALLGTALLMAMLWATCGGGGSPPPPPPPKGTQPGTYSLVLNATAGGVSRSSELTLKVN